MRIAVLTVSDAGSRGARADTSGDAIVAWAEGRGDAIVERDLVPDESEAIVRRLLAWCDADVADLVLTTGGTGLGPRDVTPEATRAVIDREVPGISEAMRAAGMRVTPLAALARQVAGQRGGTLIVNLPGSPKAARESLEAVMAALPHAVSLVRASARRPARES